MNTSSYNDNKLKQKQILGQYFTKGDCWLKPHINEFIKNSHCSTIYDPFVGEGNIFSTIKLYNDKFMNFIGLDIDSSLGWKYNDSLLNIPSERDAIIITNPPYITKYSATRKKIKDKLYNYFSITEYEDIYLLALDNMLKAQSNVIAIIPETFINSNYKHKNLLYSITILENNPFCDTETPVIVVCFDSKIKPYSEIKIYKNEKYLCSLQDIENCRITPNKSICVNFNDLNGWLGVQCIDLTIESKMIHFDFKENIEYNWDSGIKNSSRLFTLIYIDIPLNKRQLFIDTCNSILLELRIKSYDIILSPFKGNMKNGVRRRRLDFKTCRAIIEQAYNNIK